MKVCFVYSNRAEFSELKPFADFFKTKAVVDIIDLSKIINKIEIDKNLHKIYEKCYSIFTKKKYDYVCMLGDRRELPFVALASFFSGTKIVHLAAGDYIESDTSYDQYFRPIISILSSHQICFSNQSKQNIKKLFSGIGYLKHNSNFIGNPIFSDIHIENLKRPFKERYDLVLLHPQSLSKKETASDIEKLRKFLKDKKTIFIRGNNDKNFELIESFYKKMKTANGKYVFHDSLPKEEYFTLVKYCDNFYTNSSSVFEILHLNKKCLRIIGKRNKNRTIEKFNDKAPQLLYNLLKF